MSDIKLTKESEYVLTAMYKEFLDRYNQGVPRDKCKIFGHQDNILKLVPEIPEQDIVELILELKEKNMVIASKVSNIYYWVALTTDSIIFLENRTSGKISSVVKALNDLKSLLPKN